MWHWSDFGIFCLLSIAHFIHHASMWQYFSSLRGSADESDTHASKVLVSRNECGVALYSARECENKHYQTNYSAGSRFMGDITKETMRLIRITSLWRISHTRSYSILLHRRFADLLQHESGSIRLHTDEINYAAAALLFWCIRKLLKCTSVGVMQIARVYIYK